MKSNENDNPIADLHRIREKIVNSYKGDLVELTRDARRRQESSGHRIIKRLQDTDNISKRAG